MNSNYRRPEVQIVYIMGKRPYTAARKAANARYIKEKQYQYKHTCRQYIAKK